LISEIHEKNASIDVLWLLNDDKALMKSDSNSSFSVSVESSFFTTITGRNQIFRLPRQYFDQSSWSNSVVSSHQLGFHLLAVFHTSFVRLIPDSIFRGIGI